MNRQTEKIRTICVYCGSQPGRDQAYRKAAGILGTAMAGAGIGLIYGGGTKGIMGAVADAVLSAGGHVTGIIPEFLMEKEASRNALDRLNEVHVTRDMHARKHKMFEMSDAFVTLPGGIGTLEEIIEIMTWAQLGRHTKPMVLANIAGFWDPLRTLMAHMTGEGFIHTAHLVRPIIIDRAEDIVPAVLSAAEARNAGGDTGVIARM